MEFALLVEFYERISATRKRLEILDILSKLFLELKKKTEKAEDLERIVYLTQGMLFPEIMEQPKLGLAEKTLLEFLTRYYAIELKTAKVILRKCGDLGDTGQKLAEKGKGKKSQITSFMGMEDSSSDSLSIFDIYEKLKEIGEISGNKSIDKKYSKLKWLFARCNPKMIKYLLRIITSTLRVGVSDPSIMNALAMAYLGDKEYRLDIERAYNVYPDLGLIARKTFENGLDGLKEISITLGIPIRMMLASRLEYTQIFSKLGGDKFFSEYKLDGERLQIHKNGNNIQIFSRQLKKITKMYPDVVESIRKNIEADKCIIEGEAVAMDSFYEKMLPFQVLITRKRKYDIDEMVKKVPVCLFVFDILYLERNGNKEIVMDYPFLERRKILDEILIKTDNFKRVDGKMINSTQELLEYYNHARKQNCEGIMNKSIDPNNSVYKAGNRGYLWVKLKSLEAGKMTDTIDVTPIGAMWGKGRRVNQYGVLLMAVLNKENQKYEFITQCGTGFSDADIEIFSDLFEPIVIDHCPSNVVCSEKPDIWLKPHIVMEIAGDELTISPKADAGKNYKGKINESGYSVRFPSFQRIREDKSVKDITSVKEIIDLFQTQG
ncbi:MAG: ATP-dependent DNA ligase [archaeon]|nr:ATP-dependent DNA ligase [archaeon]